MNSALLCDLADAMTSQGGSVRFDLRVGVAQFPFRLLSGRQLPFLQPKQNILRIPLQKIVDYVEHFLPSPLALIQNGEPLIRRFQRYIQFDRSLELPLGLVQISGTLQDHPKVHRGFCAQRTQLYSAPAELHRRRQVSLLQHQALQSGQRVEISIPLFVRQRFEQTASLFF